MFPRFAFPHRQTFAKRDHRPAPIDHSKSATPSHVRSHASAPSDKTGQPDRFDAKPPQKPAQRV